MTTRVLHNPRIAGDVVSVLIPIAEHPLSDTYRWLLFEVSEVLGRGFQAALAETAQRLAMAERPDQYLLESARWRASISDALGQNPGLAEDLRIMVLKTRARMDEERYITF
jgi:hypothetical protein